MQSRNLLCKHHTSWLRRLSRGCRAGVAAAVLVLSNSVFAQAEETDWLAKIEAGYQRVNSFRATFSQETLQRAFARTVSAGGAITYRDKRMRWDYTYPDPQTYVVTPDALTWIQVNEEQVVEMEMDEAFSNGAPAALLGGFADVGAMFSVERVLSKDADHVRLRLKPKFEDSNVAAVEIRYDRDRRLVDEIVTYDAMGNENRVRLSAVELNVVLDDDVFALRIPEHYRRWRPPTQP